MIKDIIVTWPRNCDYPLWRQFIRDNRTKFNEIIIAFTETNQGHDYRDFVKKAMFPDYVHFVEAPTPRAGVDDWRNLAINASLLHSYNADWLWFTEQDFYPGAGFWPDVAQLESEGYEVIAAYQGNRMHPCSIFIKREMLNRTGKNFGIVTDKHDHFYLLQKDLENMGVAVGILDSSKYFHYNGLSHNWTLVTGGADPIYHPEEFIGWLKQSMAVGVPKDPEFERIATMVITKYEGQNPSPTTPPPPSVGTNGEAPYSRG